LYIPLREEQGEDKYYRLTYFKGILYLKE